MGKEVPFIYIYAYIHIERHIFVILEPQQWIVQAGGR